MFYESVLKEETIFHDIFHVESLASYLSILLFFKKGNNTIDLLYFLGSFSAQKQRLTWPASCLVFLGIRKVGLKHAEKGVWGMIVVKFYPLSGWNTWNKMMRIAWKICRREQSWAHLFFFHELISTCIYSLPLCTSLCEQLLCMVRNLQCVMGKALVSFTFWEGWTEFLHCMLLGALVVVGFPLRKTAKIFHSDFNG